VISSGAGSSESELSSYLDYLLNISMGLVGIPWYVLTPIKRDNQIMDQQEQLLHGK
jgi:hypothetical protein